jgi:hypothetical protein
MLMYNTFYKTVLIYKPIDTISIHVLHPNVCVSLNFNRGRHGRDRMVVGFTTICAISAYHH